MYVEPPSAVLCSTQSDFLSMALLGYDNVTPLSTILRKMKVVLSVVAEVNTVVHVFVKDLHDEGLLEHSSASAFCSCSDDFCFQGAISDPEIMIFIWFCPEMNFLRLFPRSVLRKSEASNQGRSHVAALPR